MLEMLPETRANENELRISYSDLGLCPVPGDVEMASSHEI